MYDYEIKQKVLCNQFTEKVKCRFALKKAVDIMECCISWNSEYSNKYFQNLEGTKVKTLNNPVKIKVLQ